MFGLDLSGAGPRPYIECAPPHSHWLGAMAFQTPPRNPINTQKSMAHAFKTAIIGGGIVGVSTAYHLAQKGQTDVVVLERAELTSGSTWHAAGNLPHFHGSYNMVRLQQYGKALYRQLEQDIGQPVGLHWTGALRLAHTDARVDEFERIAGMGRSLGLEMRMISAEECRTLHPFLNTDGLKGILWDPVDGHVDPTSLTNALAGVARKLGVTIKRNSPVLSISRGASGQWRLETASGVIEAEQLVIAAGFRSPEVAAMLGLTIPLANMEHQYLVTDAIAELKAHGKEVPMVRDPDDSYYLRQEGKGFILGPYEHNSVPWAVGGVPADFGQELLTPDLDRIEDIVAMAMERTPISMNAGIKTIVNGPITYTPDGSPLIGPVAGVDGLFLNTGSGFGIVQGGGSGKVCAEWLMHGETEWDMWELDPRRFGGHYTPEHTVAKCIEIYNHEYAAGTPYEYEMRPAARGIKTTPATERHDAANAVFFARFGWERAAWYAPEGSERVEHHNFRHSNWFDPVKAECEAASNAVALLDLTPFSKWEVSGPGARAHLDSVGANPAPRKPGGVALTHALNHSGGVRSEFTVTCLAEDHYYLISAAAAEDHDSDVLRENLPTDGSVKLERVTEQWGCLLLTGPKAREVLVSLTEAALDNKAFRWLTAQTITVAGIPLRALRVSFVGELGWELHHPIDRQGELFDALMKAGAPHGIRPIGLRAMDCLRIEKFYRNWRSDLTTEYSLLEAGMQRFFKLDDERSFRGKASLVAQSKTGLQNVLVLLQVASTDAHCIGSETVMKDGKVIGITTSGAHGMRCDLSLAVAYVEAAHAVQGEPLQVDLLGQRLVATVHLEGMYDPANERLRS
jgi:dimethylglycine dehydrogenase